MEDGPWLVAQYFVTNQLKYKHNKKYQLAWVQKYIKSVGKISLRHFNINVTETDLPAETEPKIRSRRAYIMKHMHGLPIPRSARHSLELDNVHKNTKWRDTMAK